MSREVHPTISGDELDFVVCQIQHMVKHTMSIMLLNHNKIISEEDAQDIVHDALVNAMTSFDPNPTEDKKRKSFSSWVWFKLDQYSIPTFIRKSTYKYHGKVVNRSTTESLLSSEDKLSYDQINYELDENPFELAFNIFRSKLNEKEQGFFDALLDIATESDGKQFVKKAAIRMGIEIDDARKRMRSIQNKLIKQKNLYTLITQSKLKVFKI